MSARRGWRSGRREGRVRRVQMTRHLIVSEGTETEPRYFNGMKSHLAAGDGRKLAVVVKGSGKHTLGLLDFALDYCRYSPEPFDHIWLVFDKDDFPAADFDAMERRCAECSDSSRSFHALWSNPCFELWPLLHVRYTSAQMSAVGCQRALSQAMLREFGVEYRKNIDGLFGLIDGHRAEAVRRSTRLAKYHGSLGNVSPSSQNPATKVGDIFEELGPYLA